MPDRLRRSASLLVLLFSVYAPPALGAELELIAVTGDGGPAINGIRAPRIDAQGRVVFVSTDCTAVSFECVWIWDGATLALVAQGQQTLAGIEPALFDDVTSYDDVFAGSGGAAFLADLVGPGVTGSNDAAIFAADDTGALRLVAREGAPVPGSSFVYGTFFSEDEWVAGSMTCLTSRNVAPGNLGEEFVVCADAAGEPALVLSERDPLPSSNDDWLDVELELINRNGDLLVDGFVGDGVTSRTGLFLVRADGSVDTLLINGQPAPGGSTWNAPFFSWIGVNDAREVALSVPRGDGLDGVWVPDGAGGLRLVALEGGAAPGTASSFTNFGPVILSPDGRVVFRASLASGEQGYWHVAPGGSPVPFVVSGTTAPGTGGALWRAPFLVELNATGRALLRASLDQVNAESLWSVDLDTGAAELLLREGDAIAVGLGTRTIGDTNNTAAITVARQDAGGEDGRGRSWNDAGQAAVALRFTDATEAIVRISAPEAAGGGVFALVALGALRRRRTAR